MTDRQAAEIVGCSERAWRRHTAWAELPEKRIANRKAFYAKIMEEGVKSGRVSMGDAVKAAEALDRLEAGGIRVRLSLEDLTAIRKKIEDGVAAGVLPAEVLQGGIEPGRVM